MSYWKRDLDLPTVYEEGRSYTNAELSSIADALLKQDQKTELCRSCGHPGEKTGEVSKTAQEAEDARGTRLILGFEKLRCSEGHEWFPGEGRERGIGGKNPILFEEHIQQRKRREIYCAVGTPDPSIEQGVYNRSHPQGRKINTEVQRRKHGASWYR